MWEGGHRVPGIISWPAVVKKNVESWDMVLTSDFLPTVMDILGVERPSTQRHWGMDGKSILPLLRGDEWPERGMGWLFQGYNNAGFRYGKWKYVNGTRSCSNDDCARPMLFDLDADLGERNDLAEKYPEVLVNIERNFTAWTASVTYSHDVENQGCAKPHSSTPPPGPTPTHCMYTIDTGMQSADVRQYLVKSKEECCQKCIADADCNGADFHIDGSCHMKKKYDPKVRHDGSVGIKPVASEITI